ncbi:cytochrome C [Geothermobacter hydrogeniphilus]|uniref:Cytochrome C n=1 Tax=Geothermobacter hydrogeniphilus TaxID=1969733 RepID=A0A2K2HC75_9BACT|nr:c-type cytochrome [Geothermobacter hydrogeniphilus]PNU20853.1 cytochrome C [Geothermobacter hydrogeniphilus]
MSTSDHHQDEQHADGIVENHDQRPPLYFYILFYGLIIWGVIFSAYFLLSGWSSDAEFQAKMAAHQQLVTRSAPDTSASTTRPGQFSIEAGQKIFAGNCAMCHGPEGEGGIGPDLTAATYRYGRDATTVRETISKGRPNGMPAFGTQLSAEDLTNVVGFVLSLK